MRKIRRMFNKNAAQSSSKHSSEEEPEGDSSSPVMSATGAPVTTGNHVNPGCVTNSSAGSGRQLPVISTQGPGSVSNTTDPLNMTTIDLDPILTELKELRAENMRFNEEFESLKSQHSNEITMLSQSLNEERYRCEVSNCCLS